MWDAHALIRYAKFNMAPGHPASPMRCDVQFGHIQFALPQLCRVVDNFSFFCLKCSIS